MTQAQTRKLAKQKQAFDEAFMTMKLTVAELFPVGTRVRYFFHHRHRTGVITAAPACWHHPASIWITNEKTKRVRRLDATHTPHQIEILP